MRVRLALSFRLWKVFNKRGRL